MTEKYIDLRDTIIKDLHLTESEASGADAAMRWLHMNPDQVHGRTITEAELEEAVYASVSRKDFLARLGITVIPAPGGDDDH